MKHEYYDNVLVICQNFYPWISHPEEFLKGFNQVGTFEVAF